MVKNRSGASPDRPFLFLRRSSPVAARRPFPRLYTPASNSWPVATFLSFDHVCGRLLEFAPGLSGKGTLVKIPNPLESMINVKMNLQEAPKKLTSKDFYGKIIDFQKGEEFPHRIRFTAVPSEVDAYFQALLQYGTKPVGK